MCPEKTAMELLFLELGSEGSEVISIFREKAREIGNRPAGFAGADV